MVRFILDPVEIVRLNQIRDVMRLSLDVPEKEMVA